MKNLARNVFSLSVAVFLTYSAGVANAADDHPLPVAHASARELVFPVAGRVSGAAESTWDTDIRLVN